jgi:single-strand DNA-binding protein
MGRLTADPELRQTQSGVSVTKFTVAVDRRYQQGEDKVADFINVTAWRGTAEFVSKYFKKGSMIAVQGSIQTGSYEKDGVKHYTFELVADNVSFCGSKGNTKPTTESATQSDFAPIDDTDEDLPF